MRPDNPFSRFLRERLSQPSPAADTLIERWDRLETLVVRVYRAGRAALPDREEYAELRSWLKEHHPPLAPELEAHWRGTQAGGEPVIEDPLLAIYRHPEAAAFIENWPAMQQLPAARETLNRWLRAGAGSP